MPGQVNRKGGSLTWLTVDVYEAVILPHGTLHGGESEACSLSYTLGDKERLENICQGLFVHPAAVIGHSFRA